MTDREKVIKGLECCQLDVNKCKECPYLDKRNKVAECGIVLHNDALALLKAQKPKSLTYDEARNHAMQVMNPDSIKPLFIEFREKYDDEEEERPPWRGGYNQRLLLARSMDYNVHFRFWTDRPTMEQMEATPWQ